MKRTLVTTWLVFATFWMTACVVLRAEEPAKPSWAQVKECLDDTFRKDRDRHEADIVTQSDVAELLKQLKGLGWEVPNQQELLDKVLDDGHVLVHTLRSPAGRRFMGKVADRELMYDRLERIAGVWGGPQLLRDLVKLPDGEKYARPKPSNGIPDLLDLLPKNASGKKRTIKEYDKPTGHLYTVKDLQDYLSKVYHEGTAPAKPTRKR